MIISPPIRRRRAGGQPPVDMLTMLSIMIIAMFLVAIAKAILG